MRRSRRRFNCFRLPRRPPAAIAPIRNNLVQCLDLFVSAADLYDLYLLERRLHVEVGEESSYVARAIQVSKAVMVARRACLYFL